MLLLIIINQKGSVGCRQFTNKSVHQKQRIGKSSQLENATAKMVREVATLRSAAAVYPMSRQPTSRWLQHTSRLQKACPRDTREAGEVLPPPFGCKPISPPHLNAVVGRYAAPQPLLLRPLGRKLAHASKTCQDSCLIALGIRRL